MPGSLIPAAPYLAGSITLPLGQTKYNLLTLIQALGGEYTNINGLANDVLLLADKANGDTILVGDSSITTTNYGYSLVALASRRYGPFTTSAFPFQNVWVETLGATANQIIHFEIIST